MAASQRLLVMPDDGAEAVVALIDQAQSQLLIKQFKLQSEAVEQALHIRAAKDAEGAADGRPAQG